MKNRKCMCCGKDLNGDEDSWHLKCIKRFFGISSLPIINLDKESMEKAMEETIKSGITIPGAQKKISLHLNSTNKESRLTLIGYPFGYILKPQSNIYKELPENEQLSMLLADSVGLETVPHGLISLKDNSIAYITKRIDRVILDKETHRIPMEDFCQLSKRMENEKYDGSYEQCMKIIDLYSSQPLLDKTNLLMAIIFSYIIGNSDMHLKNLSLIEKDKGQYVLSPFYDLISSKIVLNDKDDLALMVNGKKKNIRKKDFISLAKVSGIKEDISQKIIENIIDNSKSFSSIIDESFISDTYKIKLKKFIADKVEILS